MTPPHIETQAMCERLSSPLQCESTMLEWDRWVSLINANDGSSFPRDVFEAWLDTVDDEREQAAALLTRQQEEIELRDAICTEVESVRSLMEAYDRVHEELDRGVPFEKVDHGWIEPAPSYPYWQGYMQQRIMNAMRSALRKGSTYRATLSQKRPTPTYPTEGDGE